MKHDLPAFALLIDADNIRQEALGPILEEITRHARLTVRRIYGDFSAPNLAGWKQKCADHAIQPVQQYRNTIGKNATDIALIIDAMDLLHSRRFEGFCLVSSDSDFTRLATRIREEGLVVYGFGEQKAPKTLVNAFDRYIYIENLLAKPDSGISADVPVPDEVRAAVESADEVLAEQAPAAMLAKAEPVPPVAPDPETPERATNLLLRAYTNVADDTGWAMLGKLSLYIHANHPDFDPRSYGCAKFIDLIRKTEAFELVELPYKNGQSHFCRPVSSESATRSPLPAAKANGVQAFQKALVDAVTQATAENGWSHIGVIGQKLKASGKTVKGSGHSTLTGALEGSGLFDMKGAGAGRYFRLRKTAK